MAIWGIDLGGTKIEGVILDEPNADAVRLRHRISTEADKGYKHVIERIGVLIDEMSSQTGMTPDKLGIGTPGAIDPPTGLLKNSNTVCLNGQPLLADLEKKLGIPVSIANDANCFALAEARMGAVPKHVPDANVVFGVIMGTGVGGGVIINGNALNGAHGIGGEWGHNYLDASGGDCYCGKNGCVERVISGTALQRFYKSQAGDSRELKEIIERARVGEDPHAAATLDRLIHFFGLGISVVINILDPDVIVLGGGVGNIDELYTRGVESAARYTFNPRLNTPIIKPVLGDSAGVFGAALLVAY